MLRPLAEQDERTGRHLLIVGSAYRKTLLTHKRAQGVALTGARPSVSQ
ncbi:hypothetical protein ACVWW3_008061 [Bradyrhizobium sp. LM2.9]